jgi:hypothetical protein
MPRARELLTAGRALSRAANSCDSNPEPRISRRSWLLLVGNCRQPGNPEALLIKFMSQGPLDLIRFWVDQGLSVETAADLALDRLSLIVGCRALPVSCGMNVACG